MPKRKLPKLEYTNLIADMYINDIPVKKISKTLNVSQTYVYQQITKYRAKATTHINNLARKYVQNQLKKEHQL